MVKHLGLKAYGKINLGLDVLRKREDGYHEVRMIMQTVGRYDRLDLICRSEPGIRVETNLYYLPNNENNLVYQAADLLMKEFGVSQGLHIRLRKFIPVAAGMAGGSSDAAAVLFGVNKMFGLAVSAAADGERSEDRRRRALLYPQRDGAVGGYRGEADASSSHAPMQSSDCQAGHQRIDQKRL